MAESSKNGNPGDLKDAEFKYEIYTPKEKNVRTAFFQHSQKHHNVFENAFGL